MQYCGIKKPHANEKKLEKYLQSKLSSLAETVVGERQKTGWAADHDEYPVCIFQAKQQHMRKFVHTESVVAES